MSSISASDRRNQDDRVRKVREEYEAREAENNKRRNQEVKRLEQRHAAEVNQISEAYEEKIADLKDSSRDTLNKRDYDHAKDIDGVRTAYRESLKNKSEEAYQARLNQKENYEGTLAKQKQVSDSQKENLLSQLNNEISRRDQQYAEMTQETREKSRGSVNDVTRKLNDAHTKQTDALSKSYADSLETKDRHMRDVKQSYQNQLNQEKRGRQTDNSKWSQKYTDTVVNMTEEYGENLGLKQDLMNAELRSVKNKYNNKIENRLGEIDQANEDLRDSVNERMASQIRTRDSKIERLNTKLNNEVSRNSKMRAIEKRNLVTSYENRARTLEDQKTGALDDMKYLSDRRVEKVLNENQKLMREAERSNKSQFSMMSSKYREDRENMMQQHKDQVTQISNNAEGRVNKILDITNRNKEQIERYYGDSLDIVKDNYENRMEAHRDKTVAQHTANQKLMGERFRELEGNFNNKLDQTVRKYEDKIANMQDQQTQELKRMEKVYSQRMSDREKAVRQEKEIIEMKYESKMAQLKDSQDAQLDRMNRRHDEDMQNLALKMKSYSRKA